MEHHVSVYAVDHLYRQEDQGKKSENDVIFTNRITCVTMYLPYCKFWETFSHTCQHHAVKKGRFFSSIDYFFD